MTTDLHATIRAALAAATPGEWHADEDEGFSGLILDDDLRNLAEVDSDLPDAEWFANIILIASAPQWLAELLAECEALTVKRDRYLHALELVAPDGRGLQLFLGEGPAPGMPMFGSVCTESPYLIATKPEGPDASFAGAREVYQYTYDEDTQHEAEHCTVGYFVTEDWLCERDAGAEEKYDEALARAERAEKALAEVDMILNVVGADADFRRKLLCATRARLEAAEKERDAAKRETVRLAHSNEGYAKRAVASDVLLAALSGEDALGPLNALEADLARKIAAEPEILHGPHGQTARAVGQEAESLDRRHRTLCADSAPYLMRKIIAWIAVRVTERDSLLAENARLRAMVHPEDEREILLHALDVLGCEHLEDEDEPAFNRAHERLSRSEAAHASQPKGDARE